MSDERPMTVAELRATIADLPDDAYIFVDGYEGGFDRPRLTAARLKTLEPWVASSSYCGAWGESREQDGIPVWVLSRTPSFDDD